MNTNFKTLLLCGFCLATIVFSPKKALAAEKTNSDSIVIAQNSQSGFLSRKIWDKLMSENQKRKKATRNKEALSYGEVVSIIGKYPRESRNGKHFWIDETNKMTIIVRFHNNQIADMKGLGF